jgi:hypothetical protein
MSLPSSRLTSKLIKKPAWSTQQACLAYSSTLKMLLRNVGWLSTDYAALYLSRRTPNHRCGNLKSYNWLTPWRRVFLENLITEETLSKFAAFRWLPAVYYWAGSKDYEQCDFRDVTPYSVVEILRHFGGMYWLHLKDRKIGQASNRLAETWCRQYVSSETSTKYTVSYSLLCTQEDESLSLYLTAPVKHSACYMNCAQSWQTCNFVPCALL